MSGLGGSRGSHDLAKLGLFFFLKLSASAPAWTVGGDGIIFHPAAHGELVEIVAGFARFIEISGGESPGRGCVGSMRGESQRAEAGEAQNRGERKRSEDIIFHKS